MTVDYSSIDCVPLLPDWRPPRLLIRDKQKQQLSGWIDDHLETYGEVVMPPHFWIQGEKGTGKTYTVKTRYLPVVKDRCNAEVFHFEMEDAGKRDNLAAFSRRHLDETTENTMEICRQIERRCEDKNLVVIAFDDMQKVTQLKRDWSGVLHDIWEYFSEIRGKHMAEGGEGMPLQLQMILISQYKFPHRKRYLAEDVLSRYQFEMVPFGTYSIGEIKKILLQRVDAAFGELPDRADDICGYIAKEVVNRLDGDCRAAIDILRGCISERKFTFLEGMKYTEWKCDEYWGKAYLQEFPPHRAFVFYILAKLTEKRKEKAEYDGKNPPVYLNDVIRNYRKHCKKVDASPRVKQSIHNDIDKFKEYDYVQSDVLKKEDKGNYKRRYGLFITLKERVEPIVRSGDDIIWWKVLS